MKEVITSKGKTVLVPDDCDGPRNRHPKWRPNYRPLYSGKVPVSRAQLKSTAASLYGPRIQAHRMRREETPA